jgi:lanosterol synthase
VSLKHHLYFLPHTEAVFSFTPKLVSERRIYDAVDVMLTMQNPNGGFASYELVRGPQWLEYLNAAEVFGSVFFGPC